ncbi:AcrVA2 family anti-CRISPR protein [Klebsiella pneumoniae]|uniref:AcrVA2 family anti-CRISPR protein n=1 Tax=Klebsiella pneumoniae TaxID=573 RepID=UPI000AD88270|nr:hypothetical protein [Klebsiella pneumoniae]
MSHSNPTASNHLAAAGKIYPEIWRKIDALRAGGAWPEWCFIPIADVARLIRPDWNGRTDIHNLAADAARLSALASWRVTQGIYQFDPDLYESLITTAIDDLPSEVLTLLPEWGIYIETPGNEKISGFFAHCEYDARHKRPELRLLLNTPDNLLPVAIPLISGTLGDAIDIVSPGAGPTIGQLCQPLVSLVLYVCSVSADFGHYSAFRPVPVRTKRGPRIFPPESPTIVKTGESIGAVLRASRRGLQAITTGGTGRTVHPHVRRAHWHGYWKGLPPRLEVRWMPPILVKSVTPTEYTRQVRPPEGNRS